MSWRTVPQASERPIASRTRPLTRFVTGFSTNDRIAPATTSALRLIVASPKDETRCAVNLSVPARSHPVERTAGVFGPAFPLHPARVSVSKTPISELSRKQPENRPEGPKLRPVIRLENIVLKLRRSRGFRDDS